MMRIHRHIRLSALGAVVAFSSTAEPLTAQPAPKPPPPSDSVVLKASTRYEAGRFHRWLLGNTYRDEWGTPIKVAVLDLKRYGGGLKPTETGGSAQTRSLRFQGADGHTYVFRPVVKDIVHDALKPFENTIIFDIFQDGLSASHPVAPLVASPVQQAAGILHPTPTLYVMPDDPALGEFREEFAGKLGAIEEHVTMPEEGPGLGGALDIIDSEDLLEKLNEDPRARVDARALLTARLIDLLINDNDRHPDQWKWARLEPRDDAPWVPIARDRDKALVTHDGVLLALARVVKPNLVTFDARYPDIRAFVGKVIEFDQRLLIGLEKPVWDSVAHWLRATITDSVIDAAIQNMPREYWPLSGGIREKLRARRDSLPYAANRFYQILAEVPEIHGTDAVERARVTRDGADVIVRLETEDGTPWFERRFKAGETRQIRVYLHGGDDHAIITGNGTSGIFIRVVGGNGSNTILDSSTVNGRARLTRVYERGEVSGVEYGGDSVFNRRPWVQAYGTYVPPIKDRGASARPTIGFGGGSGLGVVTKLGYARTRYGFRYIPYKQKLSGDVEFAPSERAMRIAFKADRRVESSRWHFLASAMMSQLEMVEFRGFGNTVPDSDDPFFDVQQRQWIFRPAIGFALGPRSDLTLGPVVKYVVTDSLANNFISEEQPLGFPRFGQAGVSLELEHDTRDSMWTSGFVFKASSAYYAPVWDVPDGFSRVGATATTYLTFPLLTRPTLALRGGIDRVIGDAPYYEAAFVGGRGTLRTQHRQRFAGESALYGTAELRLPLLRFNYFLPWSVGALGMMEAGRVYQDGESPGTWHSARGVGGWIGFLSPKYSIHILRTNRPERRLIVGTGLAF